MNDNFNWSDLCDLANALLAETSPSQAKIRTANSRAYYAARGYAYDMLKRVYDMQFNKNSALIDGVEDKQPDIGADLRSLWDARIRADYKQQPAHTKAGAIENVRLAKEVIAKIKGVIDEHRKLRLGR